MCRSAARAVVLGALVFGVSVPATAAGPGAVTSFTPLANHPVDGAVAEIVTVTKDGLTLIYTNSEDRNVGFVDIADPSAPQNDGTVPVDGSPTSAAITADGTYALIGVDTTDGDVSNPSGELIVLDVASRSIVRTIDMGGQPDSVAVSPDGRYAAIVIENQRDEDVVVDSVEGGLPQLPAGFLRIIDLDEAPAAWTSRDVGFAGLPGLRFPTDPEPEFVDINASNVAAVTLQENNAIALVDLAAGTVISSWTVGTTTHDADLTDNEIISFDELLTARREPDAVGWTPGGLLVTANEGDYPNESDALRAGGRDFTIFTSSGAVAYEPGASFEMALADAGLYPDGRSDAKGSEPEGIEIGTYGSRTFLFVGAERGAAVAAYRIDADERDPQLVQVLATGARPEGLLAIPSRNLFVTANEDDGTISIFEALVETPAITLPPTSALATPQETSEAGWVATLLVLSGLAVVAVVMAPASRLRR